MVPSVEHSSDKLGVCDDGLSGGCVVRANNVLGLRSLFPSAKKTSAQL